MAEFFEIELCGAARALVQISAKWPAVQKSLATPTLVDDIFFGFWYSST